MPPPGKDDQDPQGGMSAAEREAFRRRSSELGRKLDTVQGQRKGPDTGTKAQGQGMAMAFRFMVELLVGVCVGAGMGWFLDQWLGTTPLLLIACLLLGFVAGMVNVVRSAQREQAKLPPAPAARAVKDDDDDDK